MGMISYAAMIVSFAPFSREAWSAQFSVDVKPCLFSFSQEGDVAKVDCSAVLNMLLNFLSPLLGALIGGGVSVATTLLSSRHERKSMIMKDDLERQARWNERQYLNLIELQEAVQKTGRTFAKAFVELSRVRNDEVSLSDVKLTKEVDEEFRQHIETLIILSARCDDAAVRSLCDSLKKKGMEALCSGDYPTLDSGARDYFAQHEKLMDLIALTLRQFSPGFKRAS